MSIKADKFSNRHRNIRGKQETGKFDVSYINDNALRMELKIKKHGKYVYPNAHDVFNKPDEFMFHLNEHLRSIPEDMSKELSDKFLKMDGELKSNALDNSRIKQFAAWIEMLSTELISKNYVTARNKFQFFEEINSKAHKYKNSGILFSSIDKLKANFISLSAFDLSKAKLLKEYLEVLMKQMKLSNLTNEDVKQIAKEVEKTAAMIIKSVS